MMFNILFKHMKGRRITYAVSLFVFMACSAIGVVPAFLFGRLVDDVIIKGQKERFFTYAALILAVVLIKGLSRYLSVLSVNKTSQYVVQNLRRTLYDKLQKLDSGFYTMTPVGDIMAQMTGDIDLMNHTVAWVFPVAVESFGIFAAGFAMLFYTHLLLTFSLFLFIPFIVVINFRLFAVMKPFYIAHRKAFQDMDRTVQENISGNRVVKAFVREDYETEKLREKSIEFRDCGIKNVDKWMSYSMPINFVVNFMSITVLAIGSVFVILSELSVGQLSMFTGLVWGLNGPLRLTGNILNDTRRALVSLNKIAGIYYAWSDIKEPETPLSIDNPRGSIVFENVSLKIKGKMLLENISFTILPGETLAVMGPTGSGKTLLLSMILRLYDPHEGRILFDGVDIRDISLNQLRKNIGISMQDVFLFSDTIDGNIAYSDPDMPVSKVYDCAGAASASGFIERMPEGYDTIIGERGVGLSGGQKQRIALARALAKDAPVLILDDTTSAVDMETEELILDALSDIKATKLIVAQRLSTVRRADDIIILENGKITEHGSHTDLVNAGGFYSRVYRMQEGFANEGESYGKK